MTAAILTITSLVAAQSYTVRELPPFGSPSQAAALNDRGEVAGAGFLSDGSEHAYIWNSAGSFEDLGTLAGDVGSFAGAINNSGDVAGVSFRTGSTRAFLWTKEGGMQDLGSFGGSTSADGINDDRQIVGSSTFADGVTIHAFIWTSTTGMQDLGTLGGGISIATAINASGQVVGYSSLADNVTFHSFLWTAASGLKDLGTLGGQVSNANAISPTGQVVGGANTTGTSDAGVAAFIWTPSQGMQPLGIQPPSAALGINASGQVVGVFGGVLQNAFVWTPKLHRQDLNSLVAPHSNRVFYAGVAINRVGQIAVQEMVSATAHAALLTPVK